MWPAFLAAISWPTLFHAAKLIWILIHYFLFVIYSFAEHWGGAEFFSVFGSRNSELPLRCSTGKRCGTVLFARINTSPKVTRMHTDSHTRTHTPHGGGGSRLTWIRSGCTTDWGPAANWTLVSVTACAHKYTPDNNSRLDTDECCNSQIRLCLFHSLKSDGLLKTTFYRGRPHRTQESHNQVGSLLARYVARSQFVFNNLFTPDIQWARKLR